MARKTTKAVEEKVEEVQVVEDAQQDEPVDTVEDEVVEQPVKKQAAKKTAKPVEEPEVAEEPAEMKPLTDNEKIRVVSLVPNVMYLDDYTKFHYRWKNVGDEVYMRFSELERMWHNNGGYFRSLWLKPEDSRVIEEFHLDGIYDNYDFLMDAKNYTYGNIDKICTMFTQMHDSEMKHATCAKIKNFISTGKLTDIRIIKALQDKLGIDLLSSI